MFAAVAARPDRMQRARLERLLWVDPATRRSEFDRLKDSAQAATLGKFKDRLAHLAGLDALGPTEAWLERIAPGKITHFAGIRHTQTMRIGLVLLVCVVPTLLVSCSRTKTPPPSPTVSTQEFEQRLDAHFTRIRSVLPDDLVIAEPARSREAACVSLGGPDWGVVPRLVTGIDNDERQIAFHNLSAWLKESGFSRTPADDSAEPNVEGQDFTGGDGTVIRLRSVIGVRSKLSIVLTGPCTWPPERVDGPPPGRLPSLPPAAEPDDSPGSAGEDACDWPKMFVYNRASPPYAGPGPHPITMLGRGVVPADLPEQWLPADAAKQGSRELTTAQLVVCVRAEEGHPSGRQLTCNYIAVGPVTVNLALLDSTYHFTVREALTNQSVGEFMLAGTEASCPTAISDAHPPDRVLLGVAQQALNDQLKPFAEKAR